MSRGLVSGRSVADALPGRPRMANGSVMYRHPRGAVAKRTDERVRVLIAEGPLDLLEVARALEIHTALASAALDSLTQRGLAERVRGYPTRWRAT